VTERLYYTDAYLTDFTATVVATDGVRVHLDRSAFYPTSGGQPHDAGELGGARVVDVVDEGDRVAHVLAVPLAFAPGAAVSGRVDWARRFDHMQQHTGQHLLSALFEELFGHQTVSVHFGDRYSTLDLSTEALSREHAARVERAANGMVLENRAVTVAFEDAASAAGLRKGAERAGRIRVVTIDGVDRSACGGTHVRVTAEIGPVVIRRIERYKQFSRVEFLCGWRALARARADFDALSAIAATMTAAIDELPALISAQSADLRAADAERRKLTAELARHRARERYDAAGAGADGVRRLVERGATMDELRALAQALTALPRVLFAGVAAGPPPALLFAASADSGVNAGAALKAALAAHGGRGGGSPHVAQGSVADPVALEAVIQVLMRESGSVESSAP